jgi:hypothetical protein
MSQGPPTHPPRKSDKPRARFSWPPTEDELAQYGAESPRPDTEFEEAGREADEPRALDVSPATDLVALFPSETHAAGLPAFRQEASPSSSDAGLADVAVPPAALFTLPEPEPVRATSSSPLESGIPVHDAPTAFDDECFEHSRSEAASTSGVAVSPGAAAVDPSGARGLADETAHLQALIEGLTQKIEWSLPNPIGR